MYAAMYLLIRIYKETRRDRQAKHALIIPFTHLLIHIYYAK